MIFLVNYSLNPLRTNLELEDEFQKFDGWMHYLNYIWFIATKDNVNQVYNRLVMHLSQDDYILVVQLHPSTEMQGWLPKDVWEWIKVNRYY